VGSSYPIVPSDSGPLRRRGGGELARPSAPGPYRPGEMGLDTGSPLRQECWDGLSPAVRQRLMARSGPVIDWWAGIDGAAQDGRARAVVFGHHGLCLAEPRINTQHRPVYALRTFVLEPTSLRHIAVDHRPPAGVGSLAAYSAASAGAAPESGADLGLSADGRGLVGNLPPKAQELLQAPFAAGRRVLRCEWHYEGSEHELSVFMIYLAGATDVTVATGTKVVPVGHDHYSAHWHLTCYRATVVRRVGV
jgi:hypothetical protein